MTIKLACAVKACNTRGGVPKSFYHLIRTLHTELDVSLFSNEFQDDFGFSGEFHRVDQKRRWIAYEAWQFNRRFQKKYNPTQFDLLQTYASDIPFGDVVKIDNCFRALLRKRRENYSYCSIKRYKKIYNPVFRYGLHVQDQVFRNRNFQRVIAVSNVIKKQLTDIYEIDPSNVTVIPNGVDLNRFNSPDPEKARRKLIQQFDVSKSDKLIVYCGYRPFRKGLDHLIKALNLIPESSVKLLALGQEAEDPYRSMTVELDLEDRVVFLGERNNVEDFFAGSDIFCLPSLYEGFSLASLEAAACGLPVLGTRISGFTDLIDHGENGYFIERDAENIADKIKILIDNDAKVDAMGEYARRKVKNQYNWSSVADQYLDVYEELLA